MSHYIALGSTFIPCPKSYNQTRLGLKFQIKRKPYTKRILITKDNIKLPPVTDRDTITNQSQLPRFPPESSADYLLRPSANTGTSHRHEYTITSRLGHIRLSRHRQPPSSATSLQTSYRCFIGVNSLNFSNLKFKFCK